MNHPIVIYKYTNLFTGQLYIGSAINAHQRDREHKEASHSGSTRFYQEIRLWSWDAFSEMEIIEICKESDRYHREDRWIRHYGTLDARLGYNSVLNRSTKKEQHKTEVIRPMPAKRERVKITYPHAKASISLLTLDQRKMLSVLIKSAQKQTASEPNKKIFTVPIDDFNPILGQLSNVEIGKHLSSLSLNNIVVEYDIADENRRGSSGCGCLFFTIKINEPNAEFTFSPVLQKYILDPKITTYIDILTIAKAKARQIIGFYEWLVDYIKIVPSYITIKYFRQILALPDAIFCNFKLDVLDSIQYEINTKTDINCKYSLSKDENGDKCILWKATAKSGCAPIKSNVAFYAENV